MVLNFEGWKCLWCEFITKESLSNLKIHILAYHSHQALDLLFKIFDVIEKEKENEI